MSKLTQYGALAFQLAPRIVKRGITAYAENKKYAHWQTCYRTRVSREEVDRVFSQMSLDSDVMVHSSLPDIGNIKLCYVTDNLKRYVLDGGHTVLCPALPIKGSSLEYLKSIKEFDVRTASNAMGAVSCFYGRQEGARRSLSPTHSVVALGERAADYLDEHHLSETPFTEKSPFYKLISNKSKILMFGASLRNLTFGHVLEDMIGEEFFPVRVYDPRRFEIELVDEAGSRMQGRFRAHSLKSNWKRDSAELMEIVRHLSTSRVLPLGCGEVILLDAREVALCLLAQLKEGLTTLGRRRVSEECRTIADRWIEMIENL